MISHFWWPATSWAELWWLQWELSQWSQPQQPGSTASCGVLPGGEGKWAYEFWQYGPSPLIHDVINISNIGFLFKKNHPLLQLPGIKNFCLYLELISILKIYYIWLEQQQKHNNEFHNRLTVIFGDGYKYLGSKMARKFGFNVLCATCHTIFNYVVNNLYGTSCIFLPHQLNFHYIPLYKTVGLHCHICINTFK
jgi:hypothetical protein